MSTPVNEALMQVEIRDLFKDLMPTYFNEASFENAKRLPAGLPFDANWPPQPQSAFVDMNVMDYQMGRFRNRVTEALILLLKRCQPSPEDHTKWVAVFRTRPCVEVGSFNGVAWPVGVWCDMAWVPAVRDLTGLIPAWES